jgi:hypothetical protein
LRQFLYDARHVNARQPARLHLPVAIDGAKQRPGDDTRLLCPTLDNADRAGFGIRAVWDSHFPARSLLICFGTPQHDCQTVTAKGAIVNGKAYQFRTAECAREP